MTVLNSKEQLYLLKKGGKICSDFLKSVKKLLRPGVSTIELDDFAYKFITQRGAQPAFKGYKGYPATICVSINDEVVHGIPSQRVIKDGDLVSIDMGIKYNGFYLDCAYTYPVGNVSKRIKHFLKVTLKSLYIGIRKACTGNYVGDISSSIQNFIEKHGFSVIRDFAGHGIGKNLHEEPQVPNFGNPREGMCLEEGLLLAIEPMASMGDWRVKILEDGWTVKTQDGSLSSHFEHTVMVSKRGGVILTG